MNLNDKIESFKYGNYKITNYEMADSPIAGLSKLMGHKVMMIFCIIANRRIEFINIEYKTFIDELVKNVLVRL